jgi:hypothetical protein
MEAAAFRPDHISGYDTKPTKQIREAMAKPVFSKRSYFEKIDFKNRGQAAAKNHDIREDNERHEALEVARGAQQRNYERMGFPFRVDDKGNKVKVDWETEEFGELPIVKKRLAESHNFKVPPADHCEKIDEWLRKNATGNWRRTETADCFKGDTRSAAEIRKECAAIRKQKGRAVDKVQTARVHSDDAKRRADADLEKRAATGQPDPANLFAGFSISSRGEYQQNRDTNIAWPMMVRATEDFETQVPMENVLALIVWSDLPYWRTKIHDLIDAQADDENAIREADKPALLKTARAELLEAQRREEAANKLCEGEGQNIFRPDDWPVIVMLEIERDDAPNPITDDFESE